MQFRLDRSIPIPLAEQIKGQITYAISYGHLPAGQALPSVRELSASLGVAPMTISQVYRDLMQQGLVVTRPGAGTFVADIAHGVAHAAQHANRGTLQQLADSYVRQSVLLGHTVQDVQQAVLQSLERYNSNGILRSRILMVGNFAAATESYAHEIEALLHDLDVSVVPVLLERLKADLPAYEGLLGITKLAVTIPPRLHEVRALLEPRYCPVAAVAFRVSSETRRRLASIRSTQRVGIVTTYPEFLQTIIENVAAYSLTASPPLCAVLDQAERVDEMLAQIDVLVFASGSESVCEALPANVEAIEFRHSPEPDSVNRLKSILRPEA